MVGYSDERVKKGSGVFCLSKIAKKTPDPFFTLLLASTLNATSTMKEALLTQSPGASQHTLGDCQL
jgi:hypothetical protein